MSKGKQTFVILTPGFPKDESDTTCLPFLQTFILELKKQFSQLDPVILALEYPLIRHEYLWNDTRVFSYNGWKKNRIFKFFIWRLILRKMKEINEDFEVLGILSLWCGPCAYLGNRFAKRNGVRHFCWIQGQDAKKGNTYVSLLKPAPVELIAISDFIRSEFERNYAIKPKWVIPAGVNSDEITTQVLERKIDILGVGSLIPLKQYQVFIEIVYLIKQKIEGIRAVICGKGPEDETLKKLVLRYGLRENITFSGELPHDEVVSLMKRSRIFLHTSIYEGFSIACMEALSAGNHIISFVKAMDVPIEHWHILATKEQMVEKACSILTSDESDYSPVNYFTVSESVQKIMKLYS